MSRSRIPHYTMCQIFKRLHDEKFGGFYGITSLDAKEAHEFYALNGEVTEDQMKPFCANFFSSDFQGWQQMGFPAWQFFKHFNSFAPKVEKKAPVRASTRWCADCQTYHSMNVKCPEKRNVGAIIGNIGKAI
jgi:hypothetical protein